MIDIILYYYTQHKAYIKINPLTFWHSSIEIMNIVVKISTI